ncbi:MAG: hypothetical protein Ct9H300mP1_32360 [Planctomycetaceae bacterium]|nr:MAG: hypothetical protein Ct9H300mP1_32360 [Planctomycetaceae bacterium]
MVGSTRHERSTMRVQEASTPLSPSTRLVCLPTSRRTSSTGCSDPRDPLSPTCCNPVHCTLPKSTDCPGHPATAARSARQIRPSRSERRRRTREISADGLVNPVTRPGRCRRGPFARTPLPLSAITISLPPLRDRSHDFQPLAQHFLERHNQTADFQVGGLASESWTALGQYGWPGKTSTN